MIAKTILSQIKALDSSALWAWGSKDLTALSDGLRFKSSGMVKWKGYVEVKYDAGQDLYNVIFSRVRKSQVIVDKLVEGVYFEDLVSVIDSQVG